MKKVRVRIFPISEKAGETPAEVQAEVNSLLARYPDAVVQAGGNFILVSYCEEDASVQGNIAIKTAEMSRR